MSASALTFRIPFLSWQTDRCDRFFLAFLTIMTAISVAVLSLTPLGLVPDEAHYWEFSRRLDWSYYSKGPIIGWAVALGTMILGDTELGVRFSAVLSLFVFSLMLYLFLRREFSAGIAVLGVVLARATLGLGQAGYIMTTDPLVFVFWLGALWAASNAVTRNDPKSWIWCHVWIGLAFLSKYTALILAPGIFLFLLASPGLRHHLRSRQWWIGVVVLILFCMPVVVWNAQHEWVNLGHNAQHLTAKRDAAPLRHVPQLIGGQFGLVGPVLFPSILMSIWWGWKRWRREQDAIAGLFVWVTLPLLALCLFVSMTRSVYANWPLPILIGGIPLLLYRLHLREANERWIWRGLWSNAGLFLLAHLIWIWPILGLPERFTPTPVKRLMGWSGVTVGVENVVTNVSKFGASSGMQKNPFVLTNSYGVASELAFYSRGRLDVRCDNISGRRMNQYDIWDEWAELKGDTAVIVLENSDLMYRDKLATRFSTLESCSASVFEGGPIFRSESRTLNCFVGTGFVGTAPTLDRKW